MGTTNSVDFDPASSGMDTFTFVPKKEGDYTVDVTFGGEPVTEQMLTAEPRLKLDKLNIFGDGLNSNKPLKVRVFLSLILTCLLLGCS